MPPHASASSVLAAMLLASAAAVSAAASSDPSPLERVLASSPALKGQKVGIYAVRSRDGVVAAAVAPDEALIPASTVKILTAACALERLGPAFRIRTLVLADAVPDVTGAVQGALYFRGGGDPELRPEDLWGLVADLAAGGVRQVDGDVVLDDSLFEPPGRPAGWPPPMTSPAPYDSPQGALALAWNSIQILLYPGSRIGDTARWETAPLSDLARVTGAVTTARRNAVNYSLEAAPDGPPAVRVAGTVARGRAPAAEWVHLGDPTSAFGGVIQRLLRAAGVSVRGVVRRGVAPSAAIVLLEHESLPLARVLAPIVKNSSNFGAEMVTRLLAAGDGETPATTAAGVQRITACAAAWEAPLDGARLVDGSGYSRSDRLSARTLVQVLKAADANPSWGADFRASLSRAGEDGSLRRRLRDFSGRLLGKTGSLEGVAALAGFLTARRGGEFAFAILLNRGPGAPPVSPASVDTVLRALADTCEQQQTPRQESRTEDRSKTGSGWCGRRASGGPANHRSAGSAPGTRE